MYGVLRIPPPRPTAPGLPPTQSTYRIIQNDGPISTVVEQIPEMTEQRWAQSIAEGLNLRAAAIAAREERSATAATGVVADG